MSVLSSLNSPYFFSSSKHNTHFRPSEILYSKYNILEFSYDFLHVVHKFINTANELILPEVPVNPENIQWDQSFDDLVRQYAKKNKVFRFYRKSKIKHHKSMMFIKPGRHFQKIYQFHFLRNKLFFVSVKINHNDKVNFNQEELLRSYLKPFSHVENIDLENDSKILVRNSQNQMMLLERNDFHLHVLYANDPEKVATELEVKDNPDSILAKFLSLF